MRWLWISFETESTTHHIDLFIPDRELDPDLVTVSKSKSRLKKMAYNYNKHDLVNIKNCCVLPRNGICLHTLYPTRNWTKSAAVFWFIIELAYYIIISIPNSCKGEGEIIMGELLF